MREKYREMRKAASENAALIEIDLAKAEAAVVRSVRTRAALTICLTALFHHIATVKVDDQRDTQSKKSKTHAHSP